MLDIEPETHGPAIAAENLTAVVSQWSASSVQRNAMAQSHSGYVRVRATLPDTSI